jgi:hypothetical protein
MAKYVRKNSTAHKVRTYIKNNAYTTPRKIAEILGCSVDTVYYAQSTMHKKKVKRAEPKQLELLHMETSSESIRPKIRLQGNIERQPEVDMVNSPPHYTAGGIETIDFIEAKNLNYNLGNAVKYITRAGLKGDRAEDLQKAKWYIEREILASHI